LGRVKGVKVAIVGDILHSRVALSNVICLRKLGAEVMLCGPTTLMPRHARELGVMVSHDLNEALRWCDVANMLRIQLERQGGDGLAYFPSLREYSQLFGLDRKRLEAVGKQPVIMHPGPINRGVEITSEVADGGNSIILEQVENGVAVRMAVLFLLAGGMDRTAKG
ncbi:MAG TPA: aspartate carbamoyltransferase, partial [Flavobacteriales bacterium]|nr:aspartate carbamoyltransferase [Flavobacteriales bacterium]